MQGPRGQVLGGGVPAPHQTRGVQVGSVLTLRPCGSAARGVGGEVPVDAAGLEGEGGVLEADRRVAQL